MSRDKPTEMQLASAKCITYLYRADALSAEDPKILYKTLPILVRIFVIIICYLEFYNISVKIIKIKS